MDDPREEQLLVSLEAAVGQLKPTADETDRLRIRQQDRFSMQLNSSTEKVAAVTHGVGQAVSQVAQGASTA